MSSYLGMFAFFSFIFDTIFYIALAIAGNEFYRWDQKERMLFRSYPQSRRNDPVKDQISRAMTWRSNRVFIG
ncbi:MAG: hypothetical protein AUF79_16815 [Crenarchaeota archaeon 13_1_20CM_2_51_8]|nr:MAG: hypothetical protein AUF79_16815 [Crenarchaeota archaeon 13_1_20CM_2_51_8]